MCLGNPNKILGNTCDFGPWKQAMECYPHDDLFFLQDQFLTDANILLGAGDEVLNALMHTAELIRNSPELCRVAWYYHFILYKSGKQVEPWTFQWPPMKDIMGETDSMFFCAVVLISGICDLLALHKKLNIPKEITMDTLSDFRLWTDYYYKQHGHWGFDQIQWLIFHFTGRLFRLGRLQFMPGEFTGNLRIFHNEKEKRLLALSDQGVRYDAEGQIYPEDGQCKKEDSWVASFEANEATIEGNPILPSGYADRDVVRLPASEWKMVLSKGDSILDIHIPRDGKMLHSLCGESMHRAEEFFAQYFPGLKYKAFTCNTWLFNPQFQSLLPDTSNILQFQREFYLYPVAGTDYQTILNVFGEYPVDFRQTNKDTLLQKAVAEKMMSDGRLHYAAGFIMRSNFKWGKALMG